jgi:hypothetical protein
MGIFVFQYRGQRKKGKAIPVTGHGGQYDFETLRFPHFLDNRLTDGGKVVTALRAGHILPPPPPGRSLVLISVRG